MVARALLPLALALLAAGAPSCARRPAARPPVDLPAAPSPSPSEEVARLVGALLSADPKASSAAECALLRLDDEHRAALAEQARRVPTERDPRWRSVLLANGLLEGLSSEERLDLVLWRATRSSCVDVVTAQSELLDLAAKDPAPLLARLSRPGPGRDAIAVALAATGEKRAVPALVDLYRGPSTATERRAAAAALARLAGTDVPLRPDATDAERAKDAARFSARYAAGGGGADASR